MTDIAILTKYKTNPNSFKVSVATKPFFSLIKKIEMDL